MLLFSALVRQHQRRFLKAAHKEIHNASSPWPENKPEDVLVEDVSSNTKLEDESVEDVSSNTKLEDESVEDVSGNTKLEDEESVEDVSSGRLLHFELVNAKVLS